MADGLTLEKLNVVLKARYDDFKKDFEAAKKTVEDARKSIDSDTKKMDESLDDVSTESARKELEKLNAELEAQKKLVKDQKAIIEDLRKAQKAAEESRNAVSESIEGITAKMQEEIQKQQAVIENLKNKYNDLLNGITADTAETSLEKQLTAAEKELTKLDAKLQPLLDKLTAAEDIEAMGLKVPGLDDVRAQIDEINPKYDELEQKIENLKNQLTQIRLNPESTTTAKKLQNEIELAKEKLRRLKEEANAASQAVNRTMEPTKVSRFRNRINELTQRFRQLRSTSNGNTSSMSSGFSRVSDGITRLRRRITSLAASALFFSVLTKGFTSLRENMYQYLQTDQQFKTSLNETKTNLKVAFAPVYQYVLPAVQSFMNTLSSLSGKLAVFTSALFGKTYDESYAAAQGIETAKNAMDEYGASAKKNLGLASFDELNNVTTSSNSSATSDNGLTQVAQDTTKISAGMQSALDFLTEFKDKIKTIAMDFSIGDFFKAGQDVSSLIVWINTKIKDAIAGVDWAGIGTKIGDFLRGLDWLKIFKSLGSLIWEGVKGASSLWFSMFKEAPLETALITVMSLWKFRKVGSKIGSLISAALPANITIPSLGFKIAAITLTWTAGFNIGKWIGKQLFPEDAEYYDNFKWFGDGGFFDNIFSTDAGTLYDAFDQMTTDLQNNTLYRIMTGTFIFPKKKTFAELKEEFQEFKTSISEKWDGLGIWFDESVQPWLSREKWSELGTNAKESLSGKWGEFTEWWSGTGIPNWWNKNVDPWFTKKKWEDLGTNAKTGLSNKWNEFTGWWSQTGFAKWWSDVSSHFTQDKWSWAGIKEGLSSAWTGAVESVKSIWNKFAEWLNEKLTITFDTSTIIGKGISDILGTSSISLGKIPTFNVAAYASGGIVPSGQLFQAREAGPELVGSIGSRTGVVNNEQIVASVSGGVESGTYRAISPIMLMLKEIISLLESSESGGKYYSKEDIFLMMQEEAASYYNRTGRAAFIF